MLVLYQRWYLGAAWILLLGLTSLATGLTSPWSVLLLALGAMVPPLIMFAFWPGGPPLTIAEVLHAVEEQQP
jgi:hypothetical protein